MKGGEGHSPWEPFNDSCNAARHTIVKAIPRGNPSMLAATQLSNTIVKAIPLGNPSMLAATAARHTIVKAIPLGNPSMIAATQLGILRQFGKLQRTE